MCLNNFELIKKHISTFENSGDNFWFVQVLTRGKDLKTLARANGKPEPSATNKVIKTWLVRDEEHLEKIRPIIIKLCNIFHARAYISVSPKSLERLNKEILLQFAHDNALGNVNNPFNIINSAAGLLKQDKNNKLWILDIDTKDQSYIDEILIEMKEYYNREPINIIPTKHGCHLLMKPFDLRDFTNDIDVHKNNPTILYIPKKIMRI